MRLVEVPSVSGPPARSPDGRWIAYSNDGGEIRRVHPDGSGNQLLAPAVGDEVVTGLRWSPRGDQLAYSAYTPHFSD